MNVFKKHDPIPGSAQSFKALCLSCLVGVSVLTMAGAAFAQSNDVMNRLDRIENEINTLNRAVYKGEAPPPGAMGAYEKSSDIEIRLQQLETQLRELTGRFEQQNYDVEMINQRVSAIQSAMGNQPAGAPGSMPQGGVYNPPPQPVAQPRAAQGNAPFQGEADLTNMPAPARNEDPSPPTGMQRAQPAPATDPAGQYEQAFAYLKAGDYGAAEQGFKAFLDQNPGHALSANAVYWLGESYYVRGQYEQAAKVFAEAYQKYPGGPKGADNLLKLGMSLGGSGKKKDACIALSQLSKEYPNGPGPILRRAEQEMATLDCR